MNRRAVVTFGLCKMARAGTRLGMGEHDGDADAEEGEGELLLVLAFFERGLGAGDFLLPVGAPLLRRSVTVVSISYS